MSVMKRLLTFYKNHRLFVSVAIALVLAGIVIWLGSMLVNQPASVSISIQVIQAILTTAAAIIPTRVLAQRQEAEISKNRARMALKRSVTLYDQMNQVALHIENQRKFIKHEADENGLIKESLVANSLDTISGMHMLQYGVIEDISSDWRDLIPEEFEKIKRTRKKAGDENDGN